MTNKEKLKRAIEQDINPKDYYKEIIYQIEEGEKMKNKKNMWKYSLVPICLIFMLGIFLFNNGKDLFKDNIIKNEKENVVLKINDIDTIQTNTVDIAGSATDITFTELVQEVTFMTNLKIPTILNNSRLIKRYDMNDEFIGYNLMYYNEDNNQIKKEIEIFFSRTLKNKPDCYKIDLDKLEDSKIKNINVKVLESNGNGNNYYYVLFNYNEYNFDIRTFNIAEQELLNLLLSIIK